MKTMLRENHEVKEFALVVIKYRMCIKYDFFNGLIMIFFIYISNTYDVCTFKVYILTLEPQNTPKRTTH